MQREAKHRLSIVVVTWNNARIIRDCLKSIQPIWNRPDVEIIVVDNASSDGTTDVVESEFPAVNLIRNRENLGFAGGNNIGIKESTGKYVSLINSDVVASQECLDELLRYMEEHPKIGVLGPKMIMPDGSVGASCMHFPTVGNWFWRALALDVVFKHSTRFGAYLMTYFRYDRTADVEVLTGWFWLVRREAMDEVGLLDERFFMYGEDIEWCKRFRDAGWRVVFYPGTSAVHQCGASSSRAPTRFYIEMRKANLQYCQYHHGRLAFVGYWITSCLHEVVRILGYGALCLVRRSVSHEEVAVKVRRSWGCLLWLMGLGLFKRSNTA
jgi:GT2 family glycosyltransferase